MNSLFLEACKNNQAEVVVKCIEELKGSELDPKALIHASENGHLEIVKLLVDNGIDVSAYGDRALKQASWNGHADVVSFLLDKTKEPLEVYYPLDSGEFFKINSFDAALGRAAYNNHLQVITLLLDRVDALDCRLALQDANKKGNSEAITLLEEYVVKSRMKPS